MFTSRINRLVVGTASLLFVGAAVLLNGNVQQRIFDAAAERQAATVNAAPLADDALRVAVCGSSAIKLTWKPGVPLARSICVSIGAMLMPFCRLRINSTRASIERCCDA